MTLEELEKEIVDLNEDPNHSHAAIPIESYRQVLDLISRVEEVAKEMRESVDLYQGYIGKMRQAGMHDTVDAWINTLEGK
jgi:ribosomal protein L19